MQTESIKTAPGIHTYIESVSGTVSFRRIFHNRYLVIFRVDHPELEGISIHVHLLNAYIATTFCSSVLFAIGYTLLLISCSLAQAVQDGVLLCSFSEHDTVHHQASRQSCHVQANHSETHHCCLQMAVAHRRCVDEHNH